MRRRCGDGGGGAAVGSRRQPVRRQSARGAKFGSPERYSTLGTQSGCRARGVCDGESALGRVCHMENRGGAGAAQMVHRQDCHGVMRTRAPLFTLARSGAAGRVLGGACTAPGGVALDRDGAPPKRTNQPPTRAGSRWCSRLLSPSRAVSPLPLRSAAPRPCSIHTYIHAYIHSSLA